MLFFLFSFPIAIAALRHLLGAIILVLFPDAAGGIGLSIMLKVIPDAWMLSILLVVSTGLALFSVGSRKSSSVCVLMLLLPQQIFLLIAALGACIAIWNGAYADGVPRSHWFILDDQLPRVTTAIVHGAATFGLSRIRRR